MVMSGNRLGVRAKLDNFILSQGKESRNSL